jgi:hypothetical protein
MQIIDGKKYNEVKVGGFILLVPAYGVQAHRFALGEYKDIIHNLKEIDAAALHQ